MQYPKDPGPPPGGERSAPSGEPRRAARGGAAAARDAVGVQLKSLFAELTSGPMPDHLLALVDQLESTLEPEGDAGVPPADAPPAPPPASRNGRP